jgi:DNA-binding NarL/FixJ family response regulator
MVLTNAGFIASTCSENDIAAMPQHPAIALAVMGHSMPHRTQIATAEYVLEKWPDARILFLTPNTEPLAKTSHNEYETGSSNPAYLVHACRAILDGTP